MKNRKRTKKKQKQQNKREKKRKKKKTVTNGKTQIFARCLECHYSIRTVKGRKLLMANSCTELKDMGNVIITL